MNKGRYHTPPKWADKLLRWYCSKEFVEEIQGDLHEWHARRVSRQGVWWARILYFLDVIRFLRAFRLKPIQELSTTSNRNAMLINYFKTGFRNFKKQKIYAAVNLFGLVAGFASCLFIVTYVQDELGYDQFHSKKDKIQRLNVDILSGTGRLSLAVSAGPMAPTLQGELAEVEDFVRIARSTTPVMVKQDQKQFFEQSVIYADPSFFKMFAFALASGNPRQALNEPNQVILSAEMARKYFSKGEALGHEIQFDGVAYAVTGIMQPSAYNSHIKFDFLVSMATWIAMRPPTETNWFWFPVTSYLQLADGTDLQQFQTQLEAFKEKYMVNDPGTKYELSIEPFANIHFSETRLGEMDAKGNKGYLFFLAGVAGFILLLAVVNFVNLSTAKSSGRAKEIGIRKTLGALRGEIRGQFLLEATLYAAGALAVAMLIYLTLLPGFSELLTRNFNPRFLLEPPYLLALALAPIALGLLAGIYPAMIMAQFKPIKALQKKASGSRFNVRRILTIFQFSVSSMLIFATVVVWMQLQFLRSSDPGFAKEQMLVIDFGSDARPITHYHTLRNRLASLSSTESITFSSHVPSEKPHGVGTRVFDPEGQTVNGEIYANMVDYDFYQNYGLELVAGRLFNKDLSADSTALIVNEATVAAMGFASYDEIIGKQFWQWGRSGEVIGVVKDFNFLSLHSEIEPLSFQMWPQQFRKISIKTRAHEMPATLTQLEQIWKEVIGDVPMNYYFLDQKFDDQYRNDQQLGNIVSIFSSISIIIAVLGLVAFATHVCTERAKEMALRKVMGASVPTLSWLLYGQFSTPVMIAFLVGIIPAYLLIEQWLQQFAYKIPINAGMILLPFLILLVILIFSVGYQSIKTASANPVNHLKDE